MPIYINYSLEELYDELDDIEFYMEYYGCTYALEREWDEVLDEIEYIELFE